MYIGDEAGLADDFLYFFPRGVADTALVIKDEGNGSGRYAGHTGNVADGKVGHNNASFQE